MEWTQRIQKVYEKNSLLSILGSLASIMSPFILYLLSQNKFWLWLLLILSILLLVILLKVMASYISPHKLKTLCSYFHPISHSFRDLNDNFFEANPSWKDLMSEHTNLISQIISNIHGSIHALHPESTLHISFKRVDYLFSWKEEEIEADQLNESTYKTRPIRINKTNIGGSFTSDQMPGQIDKLILDSGNPEHREYLFWKAFDERTVVSVDEFSRVQKSITPKYNSGLVCPIRLFGIVVGFICLGTPETHFFTKIDRDIVAALTDILAEVIRSQGQVEVMFNLEMSIFMKEYIKQKIEQYMANYVKDDTIVIPLNAETE